MSCFCAPAMKTPSLPWWQTCFSDNLSLSAVDANGQHDKHACIVNACRSVLWLSVPDLCCHPAVRPVPVHGELISFWPLCGKLTACPIISSCSSMKGSSAWFGGSAATYLLGTVLRVGYKVMWEAVAWKKGGFWGERASGASCVIWWLYVQVFSKSRWKKINFFFQNQFFLKIMVVVTTQKPWQEVVSIAFCLSIFF